MSLIPLIFDDSWSGPTEPSFRRRSGWSPDEILMLSSPKLYLRPGGSSANSRRSTIAPPVTINSNVFQANMDVQQFAPDEITVKIVGNQVVIEGNHEERQDEHGYITRHFIRKYVIPDGYDINQVKSILSSDGVLSITAPRISSITDENIREIPIRQTGKPAKQIEHKEEKQN